MKLLRFGSAGAEKPGVELNDGRRVDVSSVVSDYDEAFLGGDGIARLQEWLATHAESAPTIEDGTRVGPCIARPSKILCAGLNYRDHAEESGMPIPEEPILFTKATSSMVGPNDAIVIPRGSSKTDWEVELAIIIGRRASYVGEADALSHVAGYAVMNDVSERAWQLERGGQWLKGKSADTFAPLGPYLVTADEVPNPDNLKLWLRRNGETIQDSTTAQMIFGVAHLVSYISQFMSLLPGDIISTGTPPGVGMGFKPEPVYMQSGDVIELGVEGLGEQRQVAEAAK
jgi:2-keto-4-pentenoate hydratase/2-oxohepta-3-ene-1,7-dioic acid hydratase in catechol pathway